MRQRLRLLRHLLVGCGSVAAVQPIVALSVSAVSTAPSLTKPLVSTGLRNLANTCYLNAQLQCHFHIPKVRDLLLEEDATTTEDDEEEASSTKRSIPAQALRLTFAEMQQAATTGVVAAPTILCRVLGINVYEQQDSQEFWKLLLPALELPPLSDLYQGAYQDYITAADGSGRERRREEAFLDLSINVNKQSDLRKSLAEEFTEPELLSGDNGWRPEKDAPKVDAYKGQQLLSSGLPSILQFHLKRFQYDWQRDAMTKLNNRFELPVELDLDGIVAKSDGDVESSTSNQFDLQSIVVHVGEYGSGHYYSYVRPDVRSDAWYRFNDNVVERVSLKEVEDDAFGGSAGRPEKVGFFRKLFGGGGRQASFGWGGRSSSAYCVQYVKRSEIGKLYGGEDDPVVACKENQT